MCDNSTIDPKAAQQVRLIALDAILSHFIMRFVFLPSFLPPRLPAFVFAECLVRAFVRGWGAGVAGGDGEHPAGNDLLRRPRLRRDRGPRVRLHVRARARARARSDTGAPML